MVQINIWETSGSCSVVHSNPVLLQNTLYGHWHQQLHPQITSISIVSLASLCKVWHAVQQGALIQEDGTDLSSNPKGQSMSITLTTTQHTQGSRTSLTSLTSLSPTWMPHLSFQRRYKDFSPDSQGSGPTSQACLTVCFGTLLQTRWTNNLFV